MSSAFAEKVESPKNKRLRAYVMALDIDDLNTMAHMAIAGAQNEIGHTEPTDCVMADYTSDLRVMASVLEEMVE